MDAPAMPRWIERKLATEGGGDYRRYAVEVPASGAAGQSGPTLRMHVMERGRGRPVLMVHGNPTWGFLYRKVAARLDPARFRVILPDLVGLGWSDKPHAQAHTLDAHIDWMGALVDRLGLDDVVLVGQDWGGPIGFGAFASRTARATGLVVLNTAISPPRKGFRASAFHRFARLPGISDAVFRLGQFPQAFMSMAQGDKTSLSPTTIAAYVAPLVAVVGAHRNVAPLALARMVPDAQSHPSVPALERVHGFVSSFRGPAAIVWGTRDPILGRMLGWVEKNLPHARSQRTAAGHFLQEEVPDAIAQAIEHAAG